MSMLLTRHNVSRAITEGKSGSISCGVYQVRVTTLLNFLTHDVVPMIEMWFTMISLLGRQRAVCFTTLNDYMVKHTLLTGLWSVLY